MSDVPDWLRWVYVLSVPTIFFGLTVVLFLEGDLWTTWMMLITGILTLPNVHRFYKEVQTGHEFDDERFTEVVRKAGFAAFFATVTTAFLMAAATSPLIKEGGAGFFTIYGNLVTAMVGAVVFSAAQLWYNCVGTQRNIKEILLGDEE